MDEKAMFSCDNDGKWKCMNNGMDEVIYKSTVSKICIT